MIKRPHSLAVCILVLPVYFCFSLLVQTTQGRASGNPIVRLGSQSARTILAQGNPPQQSVELRSPSNPLENERDGQGVSAPALATLLGTVTNTYDQPVAGATVSLQSTKPGDVRTVATNEVGFFEMDDVAPGIPCRVTVSAAGFADWQSRVVILKPGQREILNISKLRIEEVQTSVTVTPESSDELAVQEVKIEEKQRVFGIIPNFFAVYDPNPAPIPARLKFHLAFSVLKDPFTLAGVGALAGLGQARKSPNYVLGPRGYAERFGSSYANQFTTIVIGGAVLPSILHQDPRYFYQGTGTKKSRALHALSNLFTTRGDNGRLQPNFSSIGGDLASAGIANTYYPESNQGAKLVLENFAINTLVHAGVRLLQEFAVRPQGTVIGSNGDAVPSR